MDLFLATPGLRCKLLVAFKNKKGCLKFVWIHEKNNPSCGIRFFGVWTDETKTSLYLSCFTFAWASEILRPLPAFVLGLFLCSYTSASAIINFFTTLILEPHPRCPPDSVRMIRKVWKRTGIGMWSCVAASAMGSLVFMMRLLRKGSNLKCTDLYPRLTFTQILKNIVQLHNQP